MSRIAITLPVLNEFEHIGGYPLIALMKGTAFDPLAAGHEAVLGPAADGGYLLIGLNRPCSTLFRGIAWSTPTVLTATRWRLQRAGMHWAELPPGWDVDTPADLRWLRSRLLVAQP